MSELKTLVLETLSEKQGSHIVSIDMRSVNPFTDYFIIATAKNLRHADSLAEDVIERVSKQGYSIRTKEGSEGSNWILVDVEDVIVHIFTQEGREQYRLETLWGDLPSEEYEEVVPE